jgi:transposase-like protein
VQQAYVCGVSTRRVDQLVESLGLARLESEVSRIAGLLDEQVTAFRERPLEGRYPYLFVDAKVEKVRDGGRVARKCVVIAHAVHETGRARDHRPRRRRRGDRGVLARVPRGLVARG